MPADLTQDILNSDVITLLTRAIPNPELKIDTASNDSDKKFTVDANQMWQISWIFASLGTSGTGGNRIMQLDIDDDAGNTIWVVSALNVHTAGTTEYYIFQPLGQEPVETVATRHWLPIPPELCLPAGYGLRIYDVATIDPSADELIIKMMINRYDV